MNRTECGRGHIYDADLYATCPYCNGNNRSINFNSNGGGSGMDSIGSTVPLNMPSRINPEELAKNAGDFGQDSIDATVPLNRPEPEEIEATHPLEIIGAEGCDAPVVGWLVCIDGPEKGRDYRIHGEFNFIGARKGDIVIKGDNTISREKHCILYYDQVCNEFYIAPSEGGSAARVDNRPVLGQVLLKPYQEIQIGRTRLLFVPFCSDKFTWAQTQEGK